MTPEEEIRAAIRAANAAWLRGEPRQTADLFDDDVLMMSPGLEVLARGRDRMVQSFVDFCAHVTTHAFEEEGDPTVHVVGDTAVATYGFRVRYEVGGEQHEETGRELLAFRHDGDAWRAIWRMQL